MSLYRQRKFGMTAEEEAERSKLADLMRDRQDAIAAQEDARRAVADAELHGGKLAVDEAKAALQARYEDQAEIERLILEQERRVVEVSA